jgi:glycosyltransferase involved in cell wall biosynthesis
LFTLQSFLKIQNLVNTIKISIVIPVYKAKTIIPELVHRIVESTSQITKDFEVILVDDGCPMNSWEAIALECKKDKRIKGILLSRNFGQHYAITAGLDYVKGEVIIVMDCDLQDKPEEIPNLYLKYTEGYDIVFASREKRKDSFIKIFISKIFYLTFSYLSGIKYDGSIASFGIYSKKVIDNVKKMREPMRAFSPLVRWTGFSSTKVIVEHGMRQGSESTYNFRKLISLAVDIILAYSDKPLKLTVKLGFIISFSTMIYSLYVLTLYIQGEIKVSGYTSLMISIWFLSGLIIFFLGIIGLYLNKIFESVKNRPLYLIDKQFNHEEH